MLRLPGDILSPQRLRNLELQGFRVGEYAVTLLQLMLVQRRQQGMKKVLQLLNVT
jgi:hypothetical protein